MDTNNDKKIDITNSEEYLRYVKAKEAESFKIKIRFLMSSVVLVLFIGILLGFMSYIKNNNKFAVYDSGYAHYLNGEYEEAYYDFKEIIDAGFTSENSRYENISEMYEECNDIVVFDNNISPYVNNEDYVTALINTHDIINDDKRAEIIEEIVYLIKESGDNINE